MADIGRISLVVAFVVTAYLTVGSALGITWRQPEVLASVRRAVYAAAALVTLAWGVLLYAFATHDFSFEAVTHYNNRNTDLVYSLSGAYAGQEGSLLMWAWGVVDHAVDGHPPVPRALPQLDALGHLSHRVRRHLLPVAILTFISDPFAKSAVIPMDGQGLNPLLQNVGMLFHPPALYLGYVAFTVPFAFAIAALITGQLGDEWIRVTRGWTLAAWAFLGLGNLLGAQWAYVELGWGGYWGWDPVENSSFMPWLTGTAFLHSVMIQKRRGMLKVWNLSLIIITFLLTIFGTFLTRSDILSSVHTFGETGLGPIFIAFMTLIDGGVGSPDLGPASAAQGRERTGLSGVPRVELPAEQPAAGRRRLRRLLGHDVAGHLRGRARQKVTVNAPFFNQVVGPILLAIVVLMGICPLIGWRGVTMDNLVRNFRIPAAVAVLTAMSASCWAPTSSTPWSPSPPAASWSARWPWSSSGAHAPRDA